MSAITIRRACPEDAYDYAKLAAARSAAGETDSLAASAE